MPLPDAPDRQPIHTRTVTCRGWRRADGLWDIEGHLEDTKAYAFPNADRGDVVAVTDDAPFAICPAVTPNFRRLVGLRIGKGWRRAIAERLGGVEGCTHLVELLGPVATTAYQTIYPIVAREKARTAGDRPPSHLDSCHALARDGAVVRREYPRWYTGSDSPDAATAEPGQKARS
jgi:hypothetical protein